MDSRPQGFKQQSQKRIIELNIDRYGEKFTFRRYVKNEFGETTEEMEKEIVIRGIYHMGISHIKIKESDGARVITKRVPTILCLSDNDDENDVIIDDKVEINGNEHRVTGKVNIAEGNFAISISLELIV